MEILNFIITFLFVLFMVMMILGFNQQIRERTQIKEERFKKYQDKNKSN